MARTSNITDNMIISAAMKAKKNSWTMKETVENELKGVMEPTAYRGRVKSIVKKLTEGLPAMEPEQQTKASKVIELLNSAFVDGRGRTATNLGDTLASVDFDALNALDASDEGVEE